jgi:HK97 family phage portal protein
VSLVARIAQGAEFRSTLANPDEWLVNSLAGPGTYAGKRVTIKGALGLAPVFSAVSIISETIGSLPFKVFQDVGAGDQKIEARTHRAWSMIHDSPCPSIPAHRFWSAVTAHLLLWGNAFLEKRRGTSGLVEELGLLDPARIKVEWDGARKRFIIEGPPRHTFSEDDVVHLTGFSLDGIVGESVISRCRQSFGTVIAREEFEGTFYKRGAVHSGILEHPESIGPKGLKNLRKSWKQVYGGNQHEVVILEEGMKFNPTTMPLKDLEFVAGQQLSRTDIAIMFRLPPSFLGGSAGDSLTYQTVEGNAIQFAQLAIAPWTNVIGRTLSNDPSIFPLRNYSAESVLEGLLRGDSGSRSAFYAALYGINAITPNEIRQKEPGLGEALPDGDKTKADLEQQAAEATATAAKEAAAAAPAPVVHAPAPASANGKPEPVPAS